MEVLEHGIHCTNPRKRNLGAVSLSQVASGGFRPNGDAAHSSGFGMEFWKRLPYLRLSAKALRYILPGGLVVIEVHVSSGLFLHLGVTVDAQDIDFLRRSDGLATAGANVLASATGFLGFGLRVFAAHAPGAGDRQLVPPVLAGTEGFQGLGRFRMGMAVLFRKLDGQITGFALRLKAAIVVGAATTGVLDIALSAIEMHHFMKQGANNLRDGPGQGFGA